MLPISPRQIHHAFALPFIYLLARSSPVTATRSHDRGPRPADPFLDPKNDPYNPLGYIASDVLTGLAFGVHGLSTSMY